MFETMFHFVWSLEDSLERYEITLEHFRPASHRRSIIVNLQLVQEIEYGVLENGRGETCSQQSFQTRLILAPK